MAANYEWADSYDTKDWDRLRKCIAPTLRVDYRSFLNKIWEELPAEEYLKMVSLIASGLSTTTDTQSKCKAWQC